MNNSRFDFLKTHAFMRSVVDDKIWGCMIGSALGDAVGLYTEFMNKSEAAEHYPGGRFRLVETMTPILEDAHRNRFAKRGWTDDTDQALLIMLSYVRGHTTNPDESLLTLPEDFAIRIKIWVKHGLLALGRPALGIGSLVNSVLKAKSYISNPIDAAIKTWARKRTLAPNGSLMRTHPVGVIGITLGEEETWELTNAVGRTTHVDPRCVVSCCIQTGLLRGIMRGEIVSEKDVDGLIERAFDWVIQQPNLMNPDGNPHLDPTSDDYFKALDRDEFEKYVYAASLEELQLDEANSMGYVYKCIGSALVLLRECIFAANSTSIPSHTVGLFEQQMSNLVMEAGDADTNGAVAGALIGAYLGYSKLPSHWALGIRHKEWLENKVARFVSCFNPTLRGSIPKAEDEKVGAGKGTVSRKSLGLEARAAQGKVLARQRTKDMALKALKRKHEREEEEKVRQRGWAGFISTFFYFIFFKIGIELHRWY